MNTPEVSRIEDGLFFDTTPNDAGSTTSGRPYTPPEHSVGDHITDWVCRADTKVEGAFYAVIGTLGRNATATVLFSSLTMAGVASIPPHQEVAIEQPQPVTTPKTMHERIDQAMRNDTCEITVSAEEVKKTYDRIYGEADFTNLTDRELAVEAVKRLNELAEIQDANPYPQLPLDFDTLLSDADLKSPQIPASVYTKAYAEYLSQFGVKLSFSWEVPPPGASDSMQHELATSFDNTTGPTSVDKTTHFKRNAVDTMQSSAMLPTNLAFMATSRIVYGDIDTPYIGGYTVGGPEFYIETDPNNPPLPNTYTIAQGTSLHESSHQIAGCGRFGDVAFDHLQGYFVYHDDTWKLAGEERADRVARASAFTTIDDRMREELSLTGGYENATPKLRGRRIAAVRDYGYQNRAEKQATDLGEAVLIARKSPDLFVDVANSEIVNAEIALMITRIAHRVPDAGELLIRQLRAAAVVSDANRRQREYTQAINELGRITNDVTAMTLDTPMRSTEYERRRRAMIDIRMAYDLKTSNPREELKGPYDNIVLTTQGTNPEDFWPIHPPTPKC